jgi:hypothetical protein
MNSYLRLPKSLPPLTLCVLVACGVMNPTACAQSVPARIELVVVEGEGVVHDVRQRTPGTVIVKVEDDAHRPVTGASVVFALPISGVSGEFTNGAKSLTVITDNDGLAAARGLRSNLVPGKLQIYVTASYRGLRARALVTQIVEGSPLTAKNPEVRSSKSGGKWKWIAVAAVAAGAAGGGVYLGTRTKSSNSPISITAGSVVFGSPR